MHNLLKVVFAAGLLAASAWPAGAAQRFVIDDDTYADKVAESCEKLRKAGSLIPLEDLRDQVQTKGIFLKLPPTAHQKLDPPDLADRLRESTLAIGSYYKCPDCGEWHFNGSAGFVVAEGGIVSTCCHVIQTEDEGVDESFAVAADAEGHVYPVEKVLAADTASDTCLLKIGAKGLKPLPLRPGARIGERVYCLSHPGGYYYMFTQGMVARITQKRNELYGEDGLTNGLTTRPILFLNVTAEFAPGSSGGPVVDESGNVVAQVASIADAGEPPLNGGDTAVASPSVPVRFCTASEELIRLADPHLHEDKPITDTKAPANGTVKSALAADPHGWIDLQPEAGLAGWTRIPVPATNHLGANQWRVDADKGLLICAGDSGHEMLRLDRELSDFVLHAEYRFVPAEGSHTNYNSGIFLRTSADAGIWHQAQLGNKSGYLFGNTPSQGENQRFKLDPTENRTKPAGEWNTVEITAHGKMLRIWFNGAVTCTFDECEVRKGFIGLEAEGYPIEFRKLKLRLAR